MRLIDLTIGDLLEKQAKSNPDQVAVVYPEHNFRVTYHEFNKLVDEAAKAFISIGVKKSDHVAMWSDNKFEWLVTQFDTARIGAVLVTVNTNYQTSELEYLLQQSDTKVLVMDSKNKINSIRLPYLDNVIVLGNDAPDFAFNWNEFMTRHQNITDEELNSIKASLHYDDVINMQYTSGTTGFPKGVMLSHYNIVNNA